MTSPVQPRSHSETNSRVMRVQRWADMPERARRQLLDRGTDAIFGADMKASIGRIIDDVRVHGDEAVCRALRTFDHVVVDPDGLRVREEEFAAARAAVGPELLAAIRAMIANIRRFNEQVMARRGQGWRFESEPGLFVGEKVTPIVSAGLFCPSGKASYPSVLAQIGTPATVAGVPIRVVITPPIPGDPAARVDAATLVVAGELGIADVFRVNGPAGVAAAAFGTQHIPKTVKIVGPGSPAVVCAQIEMQRHGTTTMMLLGPTESLILADGSADPVRLAADLLNEAEHGTDSSSVLVLIHDGPHHDELLESVQAELHNQIQQLPPARRTAAAAALGTNGGCVLVASLEEAAEVANTYAPEHLQVVTADPQHALSLLMHAGEALLGQHTTFSAANFVIGCPASLPTSGYANVSSGITAEAFLKRTAVAEATHEAMLRMAPSVLALAEHEGFPAHANAIRVRLPSH